MTIYEPDPQSDRSASIQIRWFPREPKIQADGQRSFRKVSCRHTYLIRLLWFFIVGLAKFIWMALRALLNPGDGHRAKIACIGG